MLRGGRRLSAPSRARGIADEMLTSATMSLTDLPRFRTRACGSAKARPGRWNTLAVSASFLDTVLAVVAGGVIAVSGQYVAVLNSSRQAKRDRAERRRLELQQSIRDFLTEAQNVEPWAEHRARTGNTAPGADTNKLWPAQKYLEITGDAALGTASLAFAKCLTDLVWGSQGEDLVGAPPADGHHSDDARTQADDELRGSTPIGTVPVDVWQVMTASRTPFLEAAKNALAKLA